jgi:hypothetical protein
VLNAIVKRRVAALVVGAVVLVIGIVMLSSTDVKCGNKTMQPGQICEVDGDPRSYDTMKTADQRTAYLAVGFGVLALIAGGAGFALNARQTARPFQP